MKVYRMLRQNNLQEPDPPSHHKSASRTKRFINPIFLLNSSFFFSGKGRRVWVKPWLPNKVRKPARFCDAMVGPLLNLFQIDEVGCCGLDRQWHKPVQSGGLCQSNRASHNLSALHRCVCVCVCDGHLAMLWTTSLRCDSWSISCCFVQ